MIERIREWLKRWDFTETSTFRTSHCFQDIQGSRLIIIDRDICRDRRLYYSDYTRHQNELMHRFDSLYRFVIEDESDLEEAERDLQSLVDFTLDSSDVAEFRSSPYDRALAFPDSSPTECKFEDAFIDLYGRGSSDKICKEASFFDIHGNEKFYDYLIEMEEPHHYIAVEQNGEQYHHPAVIGKERYKDQLRKQNSFVTNGNKLYRWSIGSMVDKDNFIDDIRSYFGDGTNLLTINHVKADREFKLYDHQEQCLERLQQDRAAGLRSALVVFPTGTGKTQILIEELKALSQTNEEAKVLILIPTKHLEKQVRDAIIRAGVQLASIDIHTYSWMGLHYFNYPGDYYDYIAVDEAHHAVAPTLQRTIQHFNPEFLIGMTATDKRLDARKLEDVFGQYETDMTLKEAILQGILAPIHAYRVKSNLDLSEIRFMGKDYVSTDLEKSIVIDSRDELIAKVIQKYFTKEGMRKQGVVFCVNVRHAKRMAACLRNFGIRAEAVAGTIKKSAQYLEQYEKKELQFLTSCSLISEGWDSPQTSVIVMARPTMSKVLYTQQIGRGTRKCDGKEALYIIDVVDNYGAFTNPWSIHALTGTKLYKPWADIFNHDDQTREELFLSGLTEAIRKIEEIDIFTFEEKYGAYLSPEQLARELFVSTGSIKSWMRKGQLTADVSIPFGRSTLSYFKPDRVEGIREERGLAKHDQSTIYQDFWDFIEKGDYTYSYKMVFLLSFLALADQENGICNLDELLNLYSRFYQDRLAHDLPVDRKGCPYTEVYLNTAPKVSKSILANPFEKFERKRFMFHAKPDRTDKQKHADLKDLNILSFSRTLWDELLAHNDLERLETKLAADLEAYYQELGGLQEFSFKAAYRHQPEAGSYVADSQ